jgi:hypothetical protein
MLLQERDLDYMYWIPKLHKCPFKQRYIAESAKCSTKPLSKLLTCILSAVKTRVPRNPDTCPFLAHGICIYVGHFFYEIQLDQFPLFVLQLWVKNSCVEGREVKCFADFKQGLLKKIKRKLARSFNLTLRYIEDVLSLNNYRFGDVVDRIYPIELEIKRICWWYQIQRTFW